MAFHSSRPSSPKSSVLSPAYQLKSEAEKLQEQAKARGELLKRSAALEVVARQHGFKDWNSAKAATQLASIGQLSPYAFEGIGSPLPERPFRIYRAADVVNEGIREIYRWAKQLEFIAEKIDANDRYAALSLIGGNQPYVFVRDVSRWPDQLYRLCNRGYDAFDGLAIAADELKAIGVFAWESQVGTHGGDDMFSVINDDVMASHDAVLLKKAARLLVAIASAFDKKLYGGMK